MHHSLEHCATGPAATKNRSRSSGLRNRKPPMSNHAPPISATTHGFCYTPTMRIQHFRNVTLLSMLSIAWLCLATSGVVHAQKIPAGVGEGWLPEFDHASSQIVALAEATPAEKFTWRPAP